MSARHPPGALGPRRGYDDGNSRILLSVAWWRSPAAQEPSASCVSRG